MLLLFLFGLSRQDVVYCWSRIVDQAAGSGQGGRKQFAPRAADTSPTFVLTSTEGDQVTLGDE